MKRGTQLIIMGAVLCGTVYIIAQILILAVVGIPIIIWGISVNSKEKKINKNNRASAEVLAHMDGAERVEYQTLTDLDIHMDCNTRQRRLEELLETVKYKVSTKERQFSGKAWSEERTPDMPDYHKKSDININIATSKNKRDKKKK